MPRSKKKIHYIYKTTCLVNNRYYIGMHSTNNIDDGYLGSGTRLRRSIRKYGKENHIREILEYCVDRDVLAAREKELVTPDLINDSLCMNLKPGGNGGSCNTEAYKRCCDIGRDRIKWLLKNDPVWSLNYSKMKSNVMKSYLRTLDCYIWTGKKHTEETKQKMRESAKGKQIGEKNSQYGTCWINKDNINKKIKREDLPEYVDLGWLAGRIHAFTPTN